MLHVPHTTWSRLVVDHDARVAAALAGSRSAFARSRYEGLMESAVARLRRRRGRLERLADAVGTSCTTLSAHRSRVEVPLAAVVGSVNRAHDFSAGLKPLRRDDEERWARVRAAILDERGVPPVELVALRGRYYVIDGHHRLSVWRTLGARSVEAFVRHLGAC